VEARSFFRLVGLKESMSNNCGQGIKSQWGMITSYRPGSYLYLVSLSKKKAIVKMSRDRHNTTERKKSRGEENLTFWGNAMREDQGTTASSHDK